MKVGGKVRRGGYVTVWDQPLVRSYIRRGFGLLYYSWPHPGLLAPYTRKEFGFF